MRYDCPVDLESFAEQKVLLFSAIGLPGSGYARYSAAMYFHMQGRLSPELLEIYRRCCKWDNEDPVSLALHEGIRPLAPDELAIK